MLQGKNDMEIGNVLMVEENSQKKIDKTLTWGIVFSVMWLWGVGSVVALICGLKARKKIKASGGMCRGTIRVWWCLLVGGSGVAWGVSMVVLGYLKSFL